jgi:hypothetical protein
MRRKKFLPIALAASCLFITTSKSVPTQANPFNAEVSVGGSGGSFFQFICGEYRSLC